MSVQAPVQKKPKEPAVARTIDDERLAFLLKVLRCPACRGELARRDQRLDCTRCTTSYPFLAGRPAFQADTSSVRIASEEHVSNAIPTEFFDWLKTFPGTVLNLGAGATATKLPNCIEMEWSIFRNTDVAGDAHQLPFGDDAFDAVVTFNTFEHLHSPHTAAKEIFRVLKPGGRLVVHTAYLQPVHEPPFHFFNATEYGVKRWFSDFDLSSVKPSANFNPGYT
ncbi:MAG: methyltransferase domain-containing protein, partial [Planctomycetia bacterium]